MPASLISSSEGCVVCWWALRQAGGRAGRQAGRKAAAAGGVVRHTWMMSAASSSQADASCHTSLNCTMCGCIRMRWFSISLSTYSFTCGRRHLSRVTCSAAVRQTHSQRTVAKFQMDVTTAIHACRLEVHDAVPG